MNPNVININACNDHSSNHIPNITKSSFLNDDFMITLSTRELFRPQKNLKARLLLCVEREPKGVLLELHSKTP